KRSFGATELEEGLEHLEAPHGGLPSFFRHGHQVRRPGVAIARRPIRYFLADGGAFKAALPHLPCGKGVHAGVVHHDEPPFTPADGASRNEPKRNGHAPFPVSSWRAKCIPRITNSLSFANSEFTFANNLQLNRGRELN